MRETHGVDSYFSWLYAYNLADIVPALACLEVVNQLYRDRGINAFKCFISLPSLSFHLAIESGLRRNPENYLSVLSPDLFYAIRSSIQGMYQQLDST
jgi:hypothetical protein